MWGTILLVNVACLLPATTLIMAVGQLSEVFHFSGVADYRHVTLRWEYPCFISGLYGFQIHFCELQAWGPNRCRTKVIDGSAGYNTSSDFSSYSVIINGLRMATNYSFEVRPLEARRTRFLTDSKSLTRRIIITTKGFSARASLCLPDVSEVEVLTGPHFGGRIAVETAHDGDQCAVDGDEASPRDTYLLRIDHKLCGSRVNRTAVSTFVLVQENLPILTHSTRRFLVLCTFQPETLTVRAGLNLPSTSTGSLESPNTETPRINEVFGNEVQAAPLQQLREDVMPKRLHDEMEAKAVLLFMVTMMGLVAIGLTVWWFMPPRNHNSASSILSEDATSSVFENYENSLREVPANMQDFESILEDESTNYEETCEEACNDVLHQNCIIFAIPNTENELCVTVETSAQSDA